MIVDGMTALNHEISKLRYRTAKLWMANSILALIWLTIQIIREL